MSGNVDRRTQRRIETRARLLDAARRIVARQSIEATPISVITEEADVSVGSFYNHFESKEALLEAVIEGSVESHGRMLDELLADVTDTAQVVAASVRLTARKVDEAPVWGWVAVRTAQYVPQFQSALGQRLLRDLQRGIESGRFARFDESTMLVAFGGAVFGLLHAKLLGLVPPDADRFLAEAILRMSGLRPKEAAKIAALPLPGDPTPRHPSRYGKGGNPIVPPHAGEGLGRG